MTDDGALKDPNDFCFLLYCNIIKACSYLAFFLHTSQSFSEEEVSSHMNNFQNQCFTFFCLACTIKSWNQQLLSVNKILKAKEKKRSLPIRAQVQSFFLTIQNSSNFKIQSCKKFHPLCRAWISCVATIDTVIQDVQLTSLTFGHSSHYWLPVLWCIRCQSLMAFPNFQ